MNYPQSSRRAGMFNTKTFPEARVAETSKPSYFAKKFYHKNGDVDIQIKQKTKANVIHYAIGAIVIIGVVWYANKKLEQHT